MNDFEIGQVFDNIYPPMAAIWCNMNNAKLVKNEEDKWMICSQDYQEQTTEVIEENPVKKRTKKNKTSK